MIPSYVMIDGRRYVLVDSVSRTLDVPVPPPIDKSRYDQKNRCPEVTPAMGSGDGRINRKAVDEDAS